MMDHFIHCDAIAGERINRFRREAEQERLARMARCHNRPRAWPVRLRNRTGALLVEMGTRLQASDPNPPARQLNHSMESPVSPKGTPHHNGQTNEDTDMTQITIPIHHDPPAHLDAPATPYDDMRAAIRQLPKPQQQAIILYLEHRFSAAEIGDILRIDPDAVMAHLAEAKDALRHMLHPHTLPELEII